MNDSSSRQHQNGLKDSPTARELLRRAVAMPPTTTALAKKYYNQQLFSDSIQWTISLLIEIVAGQQQAHKTKVEFVLLGLVQRQTRGLCSSSDDDGVGR